MGDVVLDHVAVEHDGAVQGQAGGVGDPVDVVGKGAHEVAGQDLAFERIAPLLWMRAGSQGRIITKVPAQGWDVAEAYGVCLSTASPPTRLRITV